MLSTAMFVYNNLCLEAVPPHLLYIIKSSLANQIAYSHSIPARISDIPLAENRKLTQKICETDLNCLSLSISRKCDSYEMIERGDRSDKHAVPEPSFNPSCVLEKLKTENLDFNTALTRAAFLINFNIHQKTNTAIRTASHLYKAITDSTASDA